MIIVGSLARQNWHRQLRQRGLDGEAAYDYVVAKTVAMAERFGFRPMAISARSPRPPAQTKAELAARGLVPVGSMGSVSLSNDRDIRQSSLENARRGLQQAAELGSDTSMFGFSRNGRVTREGQVLFAIEMLQEIGRYAAELGLRICTENYDWFTSEELVRICTGTGLDNVGILNDTGNWLILGEDPVEATRRCLPYTFHAHVRDYVLENHTYNGVAVGAGLVDFEQVLPLLAQLDGAHDMVFTVEVDTDDRDEDQCASDSFAYLRDWLVRTGHTESLVSTSAQA